MFNIGSGRVSLVSAIFRSSVGFGFGSYITASNVGIDFFGLNTCQLTGFLF